MSRRKKKNQVTLISLLVVLVLLSGFYLWYMNRDRFAGRTDKDTSEADTSLIIATMDPERIETIHFKNEKADMTFIREEDVWILEADRNRPIKQNYIKNMINLMDEVKAERMVNEKPEDLGQYGLASPFASINATQTDGKTIAIRLGSKAVGAQGYYAMIDGNDAVYILPTLYGTNLSYSDMDMTQVENGPSITSNDIYHIEISYRDGEDFELIYDPDSIHHIAGTPLLSWAVLKPYEEVYAADSSKVSELLSKYSSFDFLACVEYSTETFDKYGLDGPQASVFVEYYEKHEAQTAEADTNSDSDDNTTGEVIIEEKNFKLYIGDKNDNGDYYVRKDGDKAVYTMSAAKVEEMLTVDAFGILSTFVNLHNIDTVDKIDIDIGGTHYTMEIKRETVTNAEGEEEMISAYYYNGELTEEDKFKDLYQVMIAAKMDIQLKEEVSVSNLKPALTMSYHISGSEEPYITSYYSYDDSFYLIDSGYPVRFAADKRKIDGIIKAVQEFGLAED